MQENSVGDTLNWLYKITTDHSFDKSYICDVIVIQFTWHKALFIQ